MKCPKCSNVTLLMTEKNTIEIDYCPECRGIWLERGKLEFMLDRSINQPREDKYVDRRFRHGHDDDDHHYKFDDDDHDKHYGDGRGNRKKSFLGNLFDF